MPAGISLSNYARHDGKRPYWTLEASSGDRTYQVHNRYGAWHVQAGEKMYEPEAVFGAMAGRELKFEVSTKVASLERKIMEATGAVKVRK